MNGLSRRQLLARGLLFGRSVAAGLVLPRPRALAAAKASSRPEALSAGEWATVEAITARLIPTDHEPGAELSTWLKNKLPGYMVPSLFVTLDAVPLNPYGKIDRRALPPPGNGSPAVLTGFVEPEGDTECELAAIWRAGMSACWIR